MTLAIGPYEERPLRLEPYDLRSPAVAALVSELVRAELPQARLAHVGSTAVPGCPGKGIVDILLEYPEGSLEAAKAALGRLGFQEQTTGNPFPEDRPMRVGSLAHDGIVFLLHVHVVKSASPVAVRLLAFRDALRADPALVAQYAEEKRAILGTGVRASADYSNAKGWFIEGALPAAAGGTRGTAAVVYSEDEPGADQLFALFSTTGWNQQYGMDAGQFHHACLASWYRIGVYQEGRLVGMGRVISDGVLHALLVDVIVAPELQGQGIGQGIMERLLNRCREAGVRDVQLFCAKGKVGFYRKLGFRDRPGDAPGMDLAP
jgi:GrpB-like predicted nucleotidyltransferase (UPF0157 family)